MAKPEKEPINPRSLTEHQLLEKIYEAFIVLQSSTKAVLDAWREVLKTKRRTTMLVAIVLVMTIAQQWQLSERGKDIGKLKDSVKSMETSVVEVRESVKVIRDVADRVSPDPAAQQRSADALRKIDRICAQLQCEKEGGD